MLMDVHRRPEVALRAMRVLPRPAHTALGEAAPCIDSHGGIVFLSRLGVCFTESIRVPFCTRMTFAPRCSALDDKSDRFPRS